MNYVLGGSIRHVTIVPENGSSGHVLEEPLPKWFDPDWGEGPEHARLKDEQVLISLAGPIAEGRVTTETLGAKDCHDALGMAECGVCSDEELQTYVNRACEKAEAILTEHWAGVDALARALLGEPTIEGPEAMRIIAAALPSAANAAAARRRTAFQRLSRRKERELREQRRAREARRRRCS